MALSLPINKASQVDHSLICILFSIYCKLSSGSGELPAHVLLTMPAVLSRVRSITDAFAWPRAYCSESAKVSAELRYVRERIGKLKLGTFFSGVCTPSCSLEALSTSIPNLMSCNESGVGGVGGQLEWEYCSACEWDAECRMELACLPRPPQCIFRDIAEFLKPHIRASVDALGDAPTWKQLRSLITEDSIRDDAFCVRHNKFCVFQFCSLIIAGTPCVDFSSWGSQKHENGKSAVFLLTFAMLIRKWRIPQVIMENVQRFKPALLTDLFGDMYTIDTIVVCNTTFGQVSTRVRRYSNLTLSASGLALTQPLSMMKTELQRERDPSFTMYDHAIASPGERQMELTWAALRTSSLAKAQGFCTTRPLTIDHPDCFEMALNAWEAKHLATFRRLYPRDRVYCLQTNGEKRANVSQEFIMHTIVKNGHLQWADKLARWWTARETISFQGFPTTDHLLRSMQCVGEGAKPAPLSSFNVSRLARGFHRRCRKDMCEQMGNSMHVAVVGAVVLWSLAFVKPVVVTIPIAPAKTAPIDDDDTDGGVIDGDTSFNSFLSDAAALRKRRRPATPASARVQTAMPIADCANSLFSLSNNSSAQMVVCNHATPSTPSLGSVASSHAMASSLTSSSDLPPAKTQRLNRTFGLFC